MAKSARSLKFGFFVRSTLLGGIVFLLVFFLLGLAVDKIVYKKQLHDFTSEAQLRFSLLQETVLNEGLFTFKSTERLVDELFSESDSFNLKLVQRLPVDLLDTGRVEIHKKLFKSPIYHIYYKLPQVEAYLSIQSQDYNYGQIIRNFRLIAFILITSIFLWNGWSGYVFMQKIVKPIDRIVRDMKDLKHGVDHVDELQAVHKKEDMLDSEEDNSDYQEMDDLYKNYRSLRSGVIQHFGQLKRDAHTDPLTGLENRRSLESRGLHLFKNYIRTKVPICIAVIDIDHFKEVNDLFGHDAGDYALKVFSDYLRSRVRETDMVARIGGEEFLILLGGAALNQAAIIINKLIHQIAEHTLKYKDERFNITISVGLVEADSRHHKNIQFEEKINEADQLLYEAKRAGRNQAKW